MAEADLYEPVKPFPEAQGYAGKGEIGPCDIVATRDDEDPVVVELKEGLNLALVLQAVDRLSVLRDRTGVERAGPTLQDNHYGCAYLAGMLARDTPVHRRAT